jgi:flagellar protein FliO/FliZ
MFMETLRALFALIATLGLFAFGVYAMRRWAPKGLLKISLAADRRLSVIESLNLDATRRLILVRLDGKDRLILLGEGRELATPDTVIAPEAPEAPGAAAQAPLSLSAILRTTLNRPSKFSSSGSLDA